MKKALSIMFALLLAASAAAAGCAKKTSSASVAPSETSDVSSLPEASALSQDSGSAISSEIYSGTDSASSGPASSKASSTASSKTSSKTSSKSPTASSAASKTSAAAASSPNSASQAASARTVAISSVKKITTNLLANASVSGLPMASAVRSVSEFDSYFSSYDTKFDLGYGKTGAGFSDFADTCTNDFFSAKALILIAVGPYPSSAKFAVSGISVSGGVLTVSLTVDASTGSQTADIAYSHIAVTVGSADIADVTSCKVVTK